MGSQTSTVLFFWSESVELEGDASLARIQDYLTFMHVTVSQKPNVKLERELERNFGMEMVFLSIFV